MPFQSFIIFFGRVCFSADVHIVFEVVHLSTDGEAGSFDLNKQYKILFEKIANFFSKYP